MGLADAGGGASAAGAGLCCEMCSCGRACCGSASADVPGSGISSVVSVVRVAVSSGTGTSRLALAAGMWLSVVAGSVVADGGVCSGGLSGWLARISGGICFAKNRAKSAAGAGAGCESAGAAGVALMPENANTFCDTSISARALSFLLTLPIGSLEEGLKFFIARLSVGLTMIKTC